MVGLAIRLADQLSQSLLRRHFPTFLSRSIAVLPGVAKSAITRILNQEIGGGNPKLAHEVIYVDTMEKAGFERAVVTDSPPFSETADLVAGYGGASAEPLSTLGFIFATEVTDLLMVSGIGAAVEHATGVIDLEWVRIHVEQEPDHVEEANHSLLQDFGPDEEAAILKSAEEIGRCGTGSSIDSARGSTPSRSDAG
jgi:hypothetical protein